jgi:hypothetical protein
MKPKTILTVVAAVCVAAALIAYARHDGIIAVANQAIQFDLEQIGSSIYGFHAKHGRWPGQLEDLRKTSLPQQRPYWEMEMRDGVFVVVWHKDLKPDPKDNADRILAYHNKGLLARLGHVWVCWGDLRTEYITSEELAARLQADQK